MATDNRWGDPPAGEMRRLSGIAVAAVILSAWAMFSGMLLGLAPGLVASTFGQAVAAAIPLASFLGFLLGIGLSYAALFHCRLDGPVSGRGMAWAALGMSYVSLFAWSVILLPLVTDWAHGLIWLIVGVALAHLLVFAAESAAGRTLFVAILIGGALFSVCSVLLLRSREHARDVQLRDRLRDMGKELQRSGEIQRGKKLGD